MKRADLVAGSTSLNRELLGTTTSETGVFMAFSWSTKHASLARKATISRELRMPTNLCCLISDFSITPTCDLLFQIGILPSADSPMTRIADSTVSVSGNSTSSGFPTVRSPTTWYRNTDAIISPCLAAEKTEENNKKPIQIPWATLLRY